MKEGTQKMSNESNVLVRYVRNADSSVATQALKFHDDDRPDLLIGEVGYVSEQELHLAAGHGVILEPISEKEANELGLTVPEPSVDEKPLSELTGKELDNIAAEEGVDLSGKRSNADKVAAIEAARSAQPEGAASLPATAATGTGEPVAASQTAGSGPGTLAGGQA